MATRTLMAKATTSGLLAVALVFGTAGIASAQPAQNTAAIEPEAITVSASLNSALESLAAYATASEENLTADDLATLDGALQVIMQAKAAEGEVIYSINDEGKNVYMTEVLFGDSEVMQFYYEADPASAEAAELSDAIYYPYMERAGGNEWYPKIWSGTDSKGRWVRFNRSAQGLMVGAAGTALKAAICAIPGVNAVGCAVVWGATIVAKQVIKRVGRCPEARPWLYAYPANLGTSGCRVS
ncbi:MAG: hypothetical protein MR522_07490 [Trueperella sp.]|uniref:hypothetical protein n=1 Tax=Trueperella sp. TaxID=2699835 RepID=UPI0025D44504|nr:hypothetical protein [Trueperella sp.]MCI7306085.1 hypothetical protein [Trueperella sp.]MDY5403697.1 hypothetical protein [Trueperella sp.]